MSGLARVAEVVVGVVREALRERGLQRVLVLDGPAPGTATLLSWLHEAGIPADACAAAPPAREALVADPSTKAALLLNGPRPGADILPLGDLWESALVSEDPAAPLDPLERGLRDAFEGGRGLRALSDHLDAEEAERVRAQLLRTAPLLRPPLVPKLTEWTAGIDPGP